MTQEIRRFPRGHKVICAFPSSDGWEEVFAEKNVSFKTENGLLLVEGFVSGDEPGVGLSVVALDNPSVCLIRNYDVLGEIMRNKIESGYYDYWVTDYHYRGFSPTCPY